MNLSSIRAAALGIGLAAGALLGTGAAQAQQAQEVTFATLAPSALLWPHAVANAQGMYARRGIAVRELRVGSSTALVQAVATSSANAGAALGDASVAAIDRGAPITIAGSIIEKSILRLVVGKDVPSVKALEGATVTAGAVQGGTANLLRLQLANRGVDPSSVKMLSLTNSKDRVVALGNGQVKGALLIAPFDTIAEREGMKVLDVYPDPYIETALIFDRNWAASHRQAAVAMTQALKEAADWLYDPANKDKAIDILARYTSTPRDICAASYEFIINQQQAVGRGLRVEPAGLESLIRLSTEAGVKQAPSSIKFDVAKYFDPSFLAGK